MRRAALAAFFVTGLASATEPVRRADFPCPGCIAVIPAEATKSAPVPLLVVLHGDEGSPTVALGPWLRPAREKGMALLAVRCPVAKGCARSYWQWNGDPEFLDAQAEAMASEYPIDRDRQYLSGWSGGASYLARASARLSSRWAAISLAGGGMPPDDGACPVCPRPTYYLAGNRNPLFELTDRTRAALVACNVPVRWTLLPGSDHGAELADLSRPQRATEILDFLLTSRASCASAPPATSEPPKTPTPTPDQLPPTPVAEPPSAPETHAVPRQSPRACMCRAAGAPMSSPMAVVALSAVALALALRKRR